MPKKKHRIDWKTNEIKINGQTNAANGVIVVSFKYSTIISMYNT